MRQLRKAIVAAGNPGIVDEHDDGAKRACCASSNNRPGKLASATSPCTACRDCMMA
jgi:hypothetical protein